MAASRRTAGPGCLALRRLARAQRVRRFVEGIAAAGLDAELAVRPPFGDVEINFEHAPLGQHQIDPERERKLQPLAHEAAPRPQKQVLRGLLRDGGDAARLADVVDIVDPLLELAPVYPVMAAEAP